MIIDEGLSTLEEDSKKDSQTAPGWDGYGNRLPSGKLTVCHGKCPLVVDLPVKFVIFHSYVSLLEGTPCYTPMRLQNSYELLQVQMNQWLDFSGN